jgi:hypothetical protein
MTSRTGTGQEPVFESPYKPPPGLEDFLADLDQAKPYPYTTEVGGITFHYRAPQPQGLVAFVTAQSEYNSNRSLATQQMVRFINGNIRPDDAAMLMVRLIEDDAFGIEQLGQLTRTIARGGTARPTRPLSHWPRQRFLTGAN